MRTQSSATTLPVTGIDLPAANARLARYGRFSADGREFIITNPHTPRPWSNVIANPRMGLAVSQTGSGFSWVDNSQLAVLTRWEQDFARDASGKFLYIRDADNNDLWSLAPAPVFAAYDGYACAHGLGYTTFSTEIAGIRATWTLFVDAAEPIEYWRVTLENIGPRPRRLELSAFLEWNCGVLPSPRREFHKLFIETEYDARRGAIFARNHMWDVPNARWGHWNTPFPYVSAFGCTRRPAFAEGDKAAFLGRNGDYRAPAALRAAEWPGSFGRHEDPIAALRTPLALHAGQRAELGFVLVAGGSRAEAESLFDAALSAAATGPADDGEATRFRGGAAEATPRFSGWNAALTRVQRDWAARLALHRIATPDESMNALLNDWVRYQAISGRLWGRCGYYQQSGAFGFRDQLQDAQVWLTIEPQRCRAQINLHAAHQFCDGSVYHWWHPLSEQGHVTKMTDDLLWLAFVTANYIRETGDLSIVRDRAPFLDDPTPRPLLEHVCRAFDRVFARTSPRGLPYIGAGDWNDGLSACGLEEKGESIWLGHFLAGLLADWAEILRRLARAGSTAADQPVAACAFAYRDCAELAAGFDARRGRLIAAINEHGWDGDWYIRGTLDDGTRFGSRQNRTGRIFLNAQTWAILNEVAPPERAARCWAAVREHLIREPGALLLAPAYDAPDEKIGYITRYAPGLRENGGVYTHAATWAIAAAAKMRDAEAVGRLLTAVNPANKDPDLYWAEPYVLPGNVDGPQSPHFGRAGWTWYTGAAQWLHRVVTQWVCGVRPEWDGLRIDPCLPPAWARVTMRRPWAGRTLDIRIERVDDDGGRARVSVDGRELTNPVIAS